MDDINFFIQQYLDQNAYLIPIGLIGLWRWSVWMIKKIIARSYSPAKKRYKSDVSIVTPVYNENPVIFKKALESWRVNKPKEIIAVIDYTDKRCIKLFQEFSKKFSGALLVVTRTPGKREALADGIRKATAPIVALVDSDTLWDKNVIKNGLPPFNDKKVAGVATYQNVLKPKTFAQKIFDVQLDLRYLDEFPFLAAAGDALVCLSGRTAFYRRSVISPLLDDLVNETFLGQKVISGDDKRLTYLVLAAGWKVAYQRSSRVYTPGMESLTAYLKQRLRWTRNALRADTRAMLQGWVWKHPALAFFQIDKLLQGFVVILSPIYFFVSLAMGLWWGALIIVLWWFVSRAIKMYPHLSRRPQDIVVLPGFILYSFLTGIVKVYAFFTLNTQGWITRWDASRLPQLKFLKLVQGYAATALLFIVIAGSIFLYKQYSYFIPRANQQKLIALTLPSPAVAKLAVKPVANIEKLNPIKDMLVRRHEVQPGEAMSQIAYDNDIPLEILLAANMSKITNWNSIEPGTILSIPGKDIQLVPQNRYNYQRVYPDVLQMTYDSDLNTIFISGRGHKITLATIRDQMGEQHIKEIAPKEWYLKSTLYIRSGVTLTLDKSEVEWLKLASNPQGFAVIRTFSADIAVHDVKITSWDETKNDYDTEIKDGRSYILVKDGSRLDLYNSELAYLGYARTPNLNASPYGVSWRMSNGKLGTTLLTGEVINSTFHHNYFGNFTFGATGMVWRGNKSYENIKYGFDPHDDSNGFLFENNVAYNNGTHGIIFSKRCIYNTIRNNKSYNNKLHGIMLHEQSSNNIVSGNLIHGNVGGIVLWHSSGNVIRDNTLYDNRHGIRANVESNDNIITHNSIRDNDMYGVYLYAKANGNTIQDNEFQKNNVAVYVKTSNNTISKNTIRGNNIGVHLLEKASGNVVINNEILYNRSYGVYTKLVQGLKNGMENNYLWRNRRDIVAREL